MRASTQPFRFSIDSPLETLSNLRFTDFKLGRCVTDRFHSDTPSCFGPMEALAWWSECYLKNVDHIYVGCGYPGGLVDCLKSQTPASLINHSVRSAFDLCSNSHPPTQPNLQRNLWLPNICHVFLANTLRKMLRAMEGTDDPCTTFVFNYVAEKRKVYVRKESGAHRYSLLPAWYVRMMEDYPE